MNKGWLNYLNLSDQYERKARFIPAALSVLPLWTVAVAFGIPILGIVKLLVSYVVFSTLLAVFASHLASAFGNRLQLKMWPDWPHDAPTNRWLHPDDNSTSDQQKNRWYQVIKDLVGLDIAQAVETGNKHEIRTVINDAVSELRSRLWKSPVGERVRLHNSDYGFARNLTGLRCVWITFAMASLVGCWVSNVWQNGSSLLAFTSTLIAVGTIILGRILPKYTRQKADRYAESFFAAVVDLNSEDLTDSCQNQQEVS